ncbi:MAG: hypothetical protein V4471_02255 [Pseudomonadota bacterium]
MNNAIETFIRECGSVQKAADVLGLDREHVSAMRRGLNNVNLIYALEIQKYMYEKCNKIINPIDLVSHCVKQRLKKLALPFTEHSIKSIQISLNSVKFSNTDVHRTENTLQDLNQLRPIILDEAQQLIANANTYLLYKLQGKKTVPAWQVSLPDLLARKYLPSLLVQTFLLFERTAIGIAAKKLLGNRQGPRNYKRFRRNFDEIEGRTDELIAFLLGFGSKDSYRQTEKIYLLGCDELIRFVKEGTLKISTAAQLIRFSHKKQQKILIRNKKQILAFIYQSKKRK